MLPETFIPITALFKIICDGRNIFEQAYLFLQLRKSN